MDDRWKDGGNMVNDNHILEILMIVKLHNLLCIFNSLEGWIVFRLHPCD